MGFSANCSAAGQPVMGSQPNGLLGGCAHAEQVDALRESLRHAILDQLTEALLLEWPTAELAKPVLHFEAFLQDGSGNSSRNPVVSKTVDLSGYMTPAPPTPAPFSVGETTSTPITTAYPTSSSTSSSLSSTPVPLISTQGRLDEVGTPDTQSSSTTYTEPTIPRSDPSQNNYPSEGKSIDRDTPPAPQSSSKRKYKYTSTLRPARPNPLAPSAFHVQDEPDSERQMQIASRFPKRAKANHHHEPIVFVPRQSSLDKLVMSIWEQIHGGLHLEFEPRDLLLEEWRRPTLAAATSSVRGAVVGTDNQTTLPLTPPPQQQQQQHEISCLPPLSTPTPHDENAITTTSPTLPTLPTPADLSSPQPLLPTTLDTFTRSNIFCRKVTQASRACRSTEVIVQARWTEHFDFHVELLRLAHPSLSPTKRRKAALVEACADFGWTEKELRNKMAIWRGYREIKDAGGWAALVFAGMGLYRFCKYRVGFTTEAMAKLRILRPRIEVAADTLHPNWRSLLAVVGEASARRFCGHPHDWVVSKDGSDPVPLRSTYLERDPFFRFEHLDGGSVIDTAAWGPDDDPRWIPPLVAAESHPGRHACRVCGQEQADDPRKNACYCFPSIFGVSGGGGGACLRNTNTNGGGTITSPTVTGTGTTSTIPQPRRKATSTPPVQVFRTTNGRNNGLLALCPFERGTAIGELTGLITRNLRHVDVMDTSTGLRGYQIWQGRQGNFTRFVNHSCNPNAQFEQFVWRGRQRIVLVSKGVGAGEEVTVDYTGRYWGGLDKKCLCGEACCRYGRGV